MLRNTLLKMVTRKSAACAAILQFRNFIYRRMGLAHTLDRHGLKMEKRYCVQLSPTINEAYEDMKEYLRTKPDIPTLILQIMILLHSER